jgi:hypothetical protein
MTSSYEIYPEKHAIILRLTGKFALADLRAVTLRLWSDPRYRRDQVGLIDISNASAGVSMEDFRALVAFVKSREEASTARWAAVASTPFATACAMLYRTAVAGRQLFEVFSTWEAACGFIGVELAPDAPLQPIHPAAVADATPVIPADPRFAATPSGRN